MCRILPYTEEGVGFLSQIQYSTDNNLLLMMSPYWHFRINLTIFYALYVDGNIFELESNWEMVMQAKCPLGMCSGVATYMYNSIRKDVSLDLNTSF